jgi:hypothetical protein
MYPDTQNTQQLTADLDLFKTYGVGTASPLAMAGGVSFRAEYYQINPGDPESYINGGQTVQRGPDKGNTNVSVGCRFYRGTRLLTKPIPGGNMSAPSWMSKPVRYPASSWAWPAGSNTTTIWARRSRASSPRACR